jgi:4-carboxymuconolactone decarboxylase
VIEAVRALVRIAAALGADDREVLDRALHAAADHAAVAAVDETLLQSSLFVGYPRVLQAFQRWRTIRPLDAETAPAAVDASGCDWAERGAQVFATVYGAQHEKVRENVTLLHPDLAQWMVAEGYGRVIGRAGLELGVRELCIVAVLAPQDVVPQLYSHLRGALRAGVAETDVEEALVIALAGVSEERSTRALQAWQTVRSRRGG